jgi:chemotaxis response regulator CheB
MRAALTSDFHRPTTLNVHLRCAFSPGACRAGVAPPHARKSQSTPSFRVASGFERRAGIEALRLLVAQLPAALSASIFIVRHLAAESPGHLAHILDEAGPLPVGFGKDRESIESGRIYVALPDRHMLVGHDGTIRLSCGPPENRMCNPVQIG